MQGLVDFLTNAESLWVFPLVAVLITFALNRTIHWLISKRLRHLKHSRHVWRHALLASIDGPVRSALWLACFITIRKNHLSVINHAIPQQIISTAEDITAILLLAWFFLSFIEQAKRNHIAHTFIVKHETDQTAIDAITKLSWAFVLIFTAISILQKLNVPLASLLAFGGAAGIAMGFAAQTLVANLFGGLTIYASRIFKIGEDIIFPGTDLAGTVENIGWRATRVLGWDGKPIFIPNSLFNSSNMINHSRLSHRTINQHLLLRYENYDKVRSIIAAGNKLLAADNRLKYYVFRFDRFGDGALQLLLYAWVQTKPASAFVPYAEFMQVKEDLLLSLADIAIEHGCEFILPISQVYLHDARPMPTSHKHAQSPLEL